MNSMNRNNDPFDMLIPLKRLLVTLGVIILVSGSVFAQQKKTSRADGSQEHSLRILARAYGDSVVIR